MKVRNEQESEATIRYLTRHSSKQELLGMTSSQDSN